MQFVTVTLLACRAWMRPGARIGPPGKRFRTLAPASLAVLVPTRYARASSTRRLYSSESIRPATKSMRRSTDGRVGVQPSITPLTECIVPVVDQRPIGRCASPTLSNNS
jgi:hypothetical protein